MTLMVRPDEPIRIFREEPLTIVYRRWMCAADGCDGEMKPNGQCCATYPAQYPHQCEKCLRIEAARSTYPRIAYLPIEALERDDGAAGKINLKPEGE